MSQATIPQVVAGEQGAHLSWRAQFDRETIAHRQQLAWVLLQVIVLGLLIRALTIESPTFVNRVVPLALGGSVVSHLLPKGHRLWFFGLLSLTAILLVFGLVDGAWIIAAGLGLIALCHVPIPFPGRIGLVLAAGALLAAQRGGLISSPWSIAAWPILGSMFMFRLIVYLYDIKHAKQPTTWAERIAYFFCLPNVTFPLFPVIDFSTFRRTYFDRPAHQIYQQGIGWMVRGLTHLVLYRFIYQYATINPSAVDSGAKLVQYMVATFGLYLRVSGQFHLIVGLLHLFGFRLPETHKFFFLASSFSDLWKRINVYWKDFMQKVVYMPLFFRLKRRSSETFALVASTFCVFFATWALHSYQWFWVLGTWLWSKTDAAFWGLLALFLVANQLWDQRRKRVRSLEAPVLSTGRLVMHGLQTAGMFAILCTLWTLWNAPTLRAFLGLFASASLGWRDIGVVLGVLVTVAAAAIVVYRRSHTPTVRLAVGRADLATVSGFAFLGVIVIGSSGPAAKGLPASAHAVALNIREGRLNTTDLVELRRGYYEEMQNVSRFNQELWRLYGGSATPRNEGSTSTLVRVNDARVQIVRPNLDQMDVGARVQTNQWGMRDEPYALEKPAGTWRIALFGPSLVFGTGVNNRETFEAVVEARLNAELAGKAGRPARYEILNFAVPAASPWQHLASMRLGYVERFGPDVVLMVGTANELWNVGKYWQDVLRNGTAPVLPEVVGLVEPTGITTTMPRDTAELRIAPVRDTLMVALYGALVSEIRRMGAIPAYAAIELPRQRREGNVAPLMQRAERAGFITFDLSYVYRGENEFELILSEANAHPNAKGHRVIADGLYAELLSRPTLLGAAADLRQSSAR